MNRACDLLSLSSNVSLWEKCKNIFTYANDYSVKKNGASKCEPVLSAGRQYLSDEVKAGLTKLFDTKQMKKTILIFAMLLSIQAYGQTETRITVREIKLSGLYYYGEGVRDTLSNAKVDALSDLQYKMSVTLKSETNLNTQENSSGFTEDYSKSIQMTSIIKLKGIEYFDKKMTSGEFKVLAYVSKKTFNSLHVELKNSITDLINSAEIKEINKGLSSAISLYYEAYLKTYLTPNTIPFLSKTFNENYSDARIFLEQKLKSFLMGIVINLKEIRPDLVAEDYFDVRLKVTYNSKPVNNIDACFDLPENPIQQIENGKVILFLYSQPSSVTKEYRLNLKIPYNKRDELQSVHKLFAFTEKQIVELDFSEIVKIDFKIKTKKENYVKIIPTIKNLSISSLMWDLGNDVISNDSELLINLDFEKRKKIVLMINKEEDLSVTKFLTNEGELIDLYSHTEKSTPILSPIIEDLIQFQTYDTIIEKLVEYKNEGKIIYGKESNFVDIQKCYGIVVNPNNRKIDAFFTPKENKRKDLLNNTEIDNYQQKFIGKAIIWLQLN